MATGDSGDLLARLKSVLPRWFPEVSPIVDGVLSGFGAIGSWAYGFIGYAKLQTRLATATDLFLDLAAFDFFGVRVRRRPNQDDDALRATIKKEVLRARATRQGIIDAVSDLTNASVTVFEPYYSFDTKGFDTGYMGFDVAGRWGSRDLPYQIFIDAVQPLGNGVPLAAGFDANFAAYDGGYSEFISSSMIAGTVTDQDIYDTIEATRAAGITCWVRIGAPPIQTASLDIDFVLDVSHLG